MGDTFGDLNVLTQAADVAQGYQVVGLGTVIVLQQDPAVMVQISVIMTVD
jgi:hypothetical protein